MRTLFAVLLICASLRANEVPELIGGSPADSKDWPSSVYIGMNLGGGSTAHCTATVIGERVLLTAGHCTREQSVATFKLGGVTYTGMCTLAPGYPADPTADWSLCALDKPVVGGPYESILVDEKEMVKVGESVLLAGYGCIRPGGSGGNDGIFRTGKARVTQLPADRGNLDTVTQGGGALCFGDSGGSAYVVNGAKRSVFGVNSRGNISTTSYLSSTFVPEFREYAESFIKANGVEICGITPGAKGCR